MVGRDLRPNLGDISFSQELLSQDLRLVPDAYLALLKLYKMSAARRVWTMTAPTNGDLGNMDTPQMRYCVGAKPKRWQVMQVELSPYFHMTRSVWRPSHPEWIIISGDRVARCPLGATLRRQIMERDGYRCLYCGTGKGPFDIDHIIPVIRGGSDHPENLACACARCNRSKGAKTLEEWAR